MKNGLHIKYSPVTQAWFLMWYGTVLNIYNEKWEAEINLKELGG